MPKTKQTKQTKKIKIAILVSGGVVQDVKANQPGIEALVFDVDNLKTEDIDGKEIDRRWDNIVDECHHSTE